MAALDPALRKLIDGCDGASAHVAFIQPAGMPGPLAAEQLSSLLGSRSSRLAVVGSISYGFSPLAYAAEGPGAVQTICEAAAGAVAATGLWSHVLMGGTWDGLQRTFAQAFAKAGKMVVHVLPNSAKGASDLRRLLFEGGDPEGAPLQRSGAFSIVFAGSGFSQRNCLLAGLCPQVVIVAGGPGTHTEVLAAREAGAGLLPLVRTGGLAEGMDFGGRSLAGMADALCTAPPPDVPLREWCIILGMGPAEIDGSHCCKRWKHCSTVMPKKEKAVAGDGGIAAQCSLDEYIAAVTVGLRELRPLDVTAVPPNVWPLSRKEREWWSEFCKSIGFDSAAS
eukprot:CAMPEP_0179112958 /NCGR_PEP_ID=MMETSP0796-20121207/52828_1 /TAXON_ID=73915 /ORGANISM="Pyrodinium bahamense, Strain pbaha01" /LENGTH=335 /DNA_ID=CAMNT_0020811145 /DNA_START=21 /DNA_END=1024 /DNA_ORIENTATION=-